MILDLNGEWLVGVECRAHQSVTRVMFVPTNMSQLPIFSPNNPDSTHVDKD